MHFSEQNELNMPPINMRGAAHETICKRYELVANKLALWTTTTNRFPARTLLDVHRAHCCILSWGWF